METQTTQTKTPENVADFAKEHGITADCVFLGIDSEPPHEKGGKPWDHFAWQVTLRFKGRTFKTPYKRGIGHRKKDFGGRSIPTPPSAEDVLDSLRSDALCWDNAQDFSDFCADLGYSDDSIKAKVIYDACGKTYKRLRAFIGQDWNALVEMEGL